LVNYFTVSPNINPNKKQTSGNEDGLTKYS